MLRRAKWVQVVFSFLGKYIKFLISFSFLLKNVRVARFICYDRFNRPHVVFIFHQQLIHSDDYKTYYENSNPISRKV